MFLKIHLPDNIFKNFLAIFSKKLYFKNMKKFALVLILCLLSTHVWALNLIRDTEVENILTGYVQKIFKSAGLPPENAEVVLINDPSINAFVAGGQTIFIHTGLITHAKYVDDLIFVLSHETGHIVGGHITRGINEYKKAQKTALISTILGGVLAVAGGRPDAGIAVMIGSQTSAMGTFTAYRQVEESSADRIAVDIVKKLGYSMKGFTNIMDMIQAEERLNAGENRMSYLRTHPMTTDRRQNISHFLKNTPNPKDEKDFRRIRAKLVAFMTNEKQALYQYSGTSGDDLYAQSIIDYRQHNISEAFQKLDTLIKQEPNNPYLYELKGQFKFETGQINEAVLNYQKALDLIDAPLIRIALAQALLESEEKQKAQEALTHLERAVFKEGDTGLPWRLMATAYDRLNQPNLAQYAMARYYYATGQTKQAKKTAEKIIKKLDKNSIAYQRTDDLLTHIKTEEKND